MKKTRKNEWGITEYLYNIEILKESDLFNKGDKFYLYGQTTDQVFDEFGKEYVGNNKYWKLLNVNFYGKEQDIIKIIKQN